jgi:hypothetical protein
LPNGNFGRIGDWATVDLFPWSYKLHVSTTFKCSLISFTVLRTKSVRVKIDQMQKKVVIHSSIHRQFGRQHWQMIQQSLVQWKDNLDLVHSSLKQLDMLHAAQ